MTPIRLRTVLKSAVFSKNIYVVNGEQTLVPLLFDTRKSVVKPVLITTRNAGTGKTGKAGSRVVKNHGISLAINKSIRDIVEPGSTDPNDSSHLIIYYDLELCDGGFSSEIYQIGANTKNSEFSSFILPRGSIDWGVTKHCGGIKVKTDRYGNRKLFKLSTPIPSVPAIEGLKSFIEWMKVLKQNGKYKDVTLVAHGSTDMPVLLHNVEQENLSNELRSVVNYFGDSLKYLQNCFPEFDKYNISYIYKKLFSQEIGNAHDALRDAKVLCQIMDKATQGCDEKFIQNILKHTVSIEDGYMISAKQVAESLRKKQLKAPKNSNMERAPALPSDTLKSS